MTRPDHKVNRRDFIAAAAASAAGTLVHCRSTDAAQREVGRAPKFRAGVAVTKITPDLGVDLEGYFMKLGPIVGVHDDLHARCLVLDDGGERVAICVCDMCVIPGEVFDRAKRIVRDRTGLPTDRMLMAATHTHAAPRVGVASGPKDLAFVDLLVKRIAEAVCAAIDNLAPAKLGYGTSRVSRHTFNRRWWMQPGTIPPNPFGQATDRVQFHPPPASKNLIRPAGPVDPQLSVLSVQHTDGRPLAVLANYSLHYVGGYVQGHVSADYFGVFANRIRQLLGAKSAMVGILSNGTSGDIGNGTDFRKPRQNVPPWLRMQEVGNDLAAEALAIVERIEHRDHWTVAMGETEIEVAIRRPNEARLQWAHEIVADPERRHRHRWTPIYAREALLLAEYPPTVPVKLQTVQIGSLAICAIPCEVFAETGLSIRKSSPLEQTFVVELANQYHGYLPTPDQHRLGAYETWDARSSCLEVEAEPKIRAALLELIRQVAARA